MIHTDRGNRNVVMRKKDVSQEIQGGLSEVNRKKRLWKSIGSLHINAYSQHHKQPGPIQKPSAEERSQTEKTQGDS